MSLVRDIFTLGTAQVAGIGIRFAATSVLARELGVEQFGVLALALLLVDVGAGLALMSLPDALTRFSSVLDRPEERARFRRLVSRWAAIAHATMLVAAWPAALIGIGLGGVEAAIFVAWSVIAVTSRIAAAWLVATFNFRRAGLSEVAGAAVMLAGTLAFVGKGDIVPAMAVLAAAALTTCAFTFGAAAQVRSERAVTVALPPSGAIVRYALNATVANVTAILLWNRGEMFALAPLVEERDLGLYGAAMVLVGLVWRAVTLIAGPVVPHLARRLGEGDTARTGALIAGMTRLTLGASVATCVVLALAGPEILVLLFGPDYAPGGYLVPLLAPGLVATAMGTVNTAVQFLSNGRFQRDANAIGTLALLGLAAGLALAIGLPGAALARGLVLVAITAGLLVWLGRHGHRALAADIGLQTASGLALVAGLAAVTLLIGPPVWLRLFLAGVLCYATVAWTAGSLSIRRIPGSLVALLRGM